MIAILSCNYAAAMQWINSEFNGKIKIMRHAEWTFETYDGREYKIITREEQARGLYFEEYVRAPDFYTLEDVVKAQVR